VLLYAFESLAQPDQSSCQSPAVECGLVGEGVSSNGACGRLLINAAQQMRSPRLNSFWTRFAHMGCLQKAEHAPMSWLCCCRGARDG
jgi:hypothetical protein